MISGKSILMPYVPRYTIASPIFARLSRRGPCWTARSIAIGRVLSMKGDSGANRFDSLDGLLRINVLVRWE